MNGLHLQETPEDLVYAWELFREKYLQPKQARWYKRWKPSPPTHYLMVKDLGQHSVNVYMAPRAFSKSTVMRELAMLLALTRQDFAVALVTATGKKSRKAMWQILKQFQDNPLIAEDFGVLRPKRGFRPWGTDFVVLPNGSSIEGLSAQGALRGERPDLFILDDPEYDEDAGSDITKLMEDFENLFFGVILPMMEEGCGLFWIGTAIPRSYIYHVCTGNDSRFQYFNRKKLAILAPDGTPIWAEKWDAQTVEDLRLSLGESKFQQEYMNNPSAGSSRVLSIHPRFHVYRVDGQPHKDREPLLSTNVLSYDVPVKDGSPDQFGTVRVPFGEWAQGLYRLITVDFIRKPSKNSDYACVQVLGFDNQDVLWVLDTFLERASTDTLIRVAFDMSQRWRVPMIGAEAVSFQEHMTDRMASLISELSQGRSVVPRIVPIKYAKRYLKDSDAPTLTSKGERIAGMEWRFKQNRIRLPEHRRGEFPISQLFYQIENFTVDLALLRFDDALDTLAMHQYLVRRQGNARQRESVALSPVELIKRGELLTEDGVPRILAVPMEQVDMSLYKAARQKVYDEMEVPQEEPEITWGQNRISTWATSFR